MINIDIELGKILRASGSALIANDARSAFATTNKEIREDNSVHGGNGDEPFWDLFSDEKTHVFAIFSPTTVELYVFSSPNFNALIEELNTLTMVDVAKLKELLAAKYGVANPQIAVSRSLAEYWLNG